MSQPASGLIDRLPTQCFHAFIVDNVAVADESILTVSRIGIERHIGNQSDWNLSVLHRPHRPADQVVRIAGFFTVRSLLFLRRDRKNCNGRNASSAAFRTSSTNKSIEYRTTPGIEATGICWFASFHHEYRPDQVIHRELIFSEPIAATMPCDDSAEGE